MPGRYRQHELLRSYAASTAAGEPGPEPGHPLQRLSYWYAAMVDRAAAAAYPWIAPLMPARVDLDPAFPSFEDTSAGLGLLVVLGAILVSRAPVFVLVNLAGYLLENGDDRSLGYSATASICGRVGLAAAGLVTIPAFVALGALAALSVMDLVQAIALLLLTRASGVIQSTKHLAKPRAETKPFGEFHGAGVGLHDFDRPVGAAAARRWRVQ